MEKRAGTKVTLAEVVRELPRRAHDLPRATVRDSQRWRLLEAMTEVCAKDGYGEASVAAVIAAAGVSRKTFYEHFQDKEECFLAAYDVLSERLVEALVAAGKRHESGPAQRRAQVETFLRAMARDVLAARVFMVDVLGAGQRAIMRREVVNARFAEAVFGASTQDAIRRRAIVGGVNNVVAGALLEGQSRPLLALAEPLSAFIESALR
jgi:AcrR family transcriptional regulator